MNRHIPTNISVPREEQVPLARKLYASATLLYFSTIISGLRVSIQVLIFFVADVLHWACPKHSTAGRAKRVELWDAH